MLVQLDGVTAFVCAEDVHPAKILHADLDFILRLAVPHCCSLALLVRGRKNKMQRVIDIGYVIESTSEFEFQTQRLALDQ